MESSRGKQKCWKIETGVAEAEEEEEDGGEYARLLTLVIVHGDHTRHGDGDKKPIVHRRRKNG